MLYTEPIEMPLAHLEDYTMFSAQQYNCTMKSSEDSAFKKLAH